MLWGEAPRAPQLVSLSHSLLLPAGAWNLESQPEEEAGIEGTKGYLVQHPPDVWGVRALVASPDLHQLP